MSARTLGTLSVMAALTLVETRLSRRNERALRGAGAVEPDGDVYRAMRWAYPGAFTAMAIEAWLRGTPGGLAFGAGAAVFAASKTLKYWAIASLGRLWSFRVLVLPGQPLVTSGPYRFLRHPNYVAVMGELVGSALLFAAPVTGALGTLLFAVLLRRRIRVENRALGIDRARR